jgi:hypothetical protein
VPIFCHRSLPPPNIKYAFAGITGCVPKDGDEAAMKRRGADAAETVETETAQEEEEKEKGKKEADDDSMGAACEALCGAAEVRQISACGGSDIARI